MTDKTKPFIVNIPERLVLPWLGRGQEWLITLLEDEAVKDLNRQLQGFAEGKS